MKATYVQRGEYLDYIPQNATAAGSVVVQGNLVGVAKLDIKAGELGAIATAGVYDVEKDTNAIDLGALVYWNGEKATASANNGLTGDSLVSYVRIGKAIAAAAAGDGTVRILLNG